MEINSHSIIGRRLKAFALDYFVILIYIGLLVCLALFISRLFNLNLENVSPEAAELIGFATLTLPVILYFTLTESGNKSGSIGKRKTGLKVVSANGTKSGFNPLLLRNFIKFLPWEIAHFFIYQLFFFQKINKEPPGWVFAGLVAAQTLALLYLLMMIFTKENRSLYEIISGTKVVLRG